MTLGEIIAGMFIGASLRRPLDTATPTRNDISNDRRNDVRNVVTLANQRTKETRNDAAPNATTIGSTDAPIDATLEPNNARAATIVALGGGVFSVSPRVACQTRPKSDVEAVARFVEEISISLHAAGLDGAPQRWRMVAANYRLNVAQFGWPELADRTLSMLLIANGCRRISPKGGGGPYPLKRFPCRSVLIVFPFEEAEGADDEL